MILWCDVETEGLKPDHRILEIGFIVTDDALREFGSWSHLVVPPGLSKLTCDPVAQKMHEKSGLWEDLMKIPPMTSTHPLRDFAPKTVEALAMTFVHMNIGDKPTLAGSSIHFDRAKIDRDMPKLGAMFHHRMIDVSSIKELAKRWAPDLVWKGDSMKTHRPLDDIRASIAELQHYEKWGFINNVI